MAKLTRAQREALELVRMRIDPKHPLFSGSAKVAALLGDDNLRAYLSTWVIPYVEFCLTGGDSFMRREVSQDYALRHERRATHQRCAAAGML